LADFKPTSPKFHRICASAGSQRRGRSPPRDGVPLELEHSAIVPWDPRPTASAKGAEQFARRISASRTITYPPHAARLCTCGCGTSSKPTQTSCALAGNFRAASTGAVRSFGPRTCLTGGIAAFPGLVYTRASRRFWTSQRLPIRRSKGETNDQAKTHRARRIRDTRPRTDD
jgi:hypothetical protein